MPFTPSVEIIDRVSARALASDEIRPKLDALEFGSVEVPRFLHDRQSEIWSEAAPQIASFNEADKAAVTAQAAVDASAKDKPRLVRFFQDTVGNAAAGTLGVAALVWPVLFFQRIRHWVFDFFSHFHGPQKLALFLLVFAGVILVFLRLAGNRFFTAYAHQVAQEKAAAEQAAANRDQLQKEIEPAIEASITAHLREFIDMNSTPSLSLALQESDTPSLSEVFDPQFDVITDSRRYVRGLVERLNGGSIGVAGPRGCGKTTLLRSFCPEGIVNPKELTVFATAPVQYEPRDFLLQLFTMVCTRVLAMETKVEEASAWTDMDSLRGEALPGFLSAAVVAPLLVLVSFFLLGMGTVLGGVRVLQSRHPLPSASSTAPGAKPAPVQTGPPPAVWVLVNSDAFTYLLWGGLAWLFGTLLQMEHRPAVIRVLGLSFNMRASGLSKSASGPPAAADTEIAKDALPLVTRARRTLRALRFQQSYSSGWSGSLKLPMGLEGGANTAMTFAERQLSLPEVVHEYRDFLKEAARRYDRITIAIDEMDKLPSDEDAKKFLNGIKAIFGQEKVYYLVSISENALSNFERRGLPIRDEFDSSFDDAVHLGYFDLLSSRRLLARRSSTPPSVPYRAFCHVVSGGLPRDLIRSCRKMYDYRRSVQGPLLLSDLCTALVGKDIEAKLGALRLSLQQLSDERGTVSVLALMALTVWTPDNLQDVIYKLHHAQSGLASADSASAANENLLALAGIMEELKAFLYFSLAVMTTFQSIQNEQKFQELDNAKVFDRLAMARQMLAVNRISAIEGLNSITPLPMQSALNALSS